MAKISKTLKHQVRRAGRDTFKRKITWAIKPGDLVEDKSGNIGASTFKDIDLVRSFQQM